jgi:protein-L-isoaspartate(D-aspartate) O-methyltransferase
MGEEDSVSATAAALHTRLVDLLKSSGAIASFPIEAAFRKVRRHQFVDDFFLFNPDGTFRTGRGGERAREGDLQILYADSAVATKLVDGMAVSSSSTPSLMARMLELLELDDGMAVLEVGAGTGYNAALLAELVGTRGRVVTLDIYPDVVDQARRNLSAQGYTQVVVECRDGFIGAPEFGKFDRMVVTGGASDLSPLWVKQFNDDGFALVPLDHAGAHPLIRVSGRSVRVLGRAVDWSGFLQLAGRLASESPHGMRLPRQNERILHAQLWSQFDTARRDNEGWSQDQRDFYFYLSISDSRTCHGIHGFGLSDRRGWAVVGEDAILSLGDASLVRDLDGYYHGWQHLGRPSVRAFEIEFVPRSARKPSTANRQWIVERRHHWEVVRLT